MENKMLKNTVHTTLLIVLFGFTGASYAALVKITFDGTIDRVNAGPYIVGQKVSGVLIYDSEAPLSSITTGSPPYTYNFNGAIDSFALGNKQVDHVTFNILAQTLLSDPTEYKVSFNVKGYDETTDLYENTDLYFVGSSLLSSTHQIMTEPNLATMSSATFSYNLEKIGLYDGFVEERFYGVVDSLVVTIVPIPAALWLFGSGLLGLIGISRCKKSD
jgi:hypothetical protein